MREGGSIRGLLIALLALTPLLLLPTAVPSPGGLSGQWTWTYPHASVIFGGSATTAPGIVGGEPGSLALGPRSGQWTVELPSAIVTCDEGRPLYTPKLSGLPVAQTSPNGRCHLYHYTNGQYYATWVMREGGDFVELGPMRGEGIFR